jgi:lipoyl-dependent peroxiredoxin
MSKTATAVWNGTGKEGKGNLTTQSKALSNAAYTWASRFSDGIGTNPEELIAAAHAGCFTMKLSFLIVEAGFAADTLTTTCSVTLASGAITGSHLVVKGKVSGMTKEAFLSAAENAKANCPVSKLLNTNITMEATLE